MPENRLAQETSPYLRQHKDNPVDWHPWGPDALEIARRENKPVLLSVGYAACHWCHVMAHESFETTEIAARMNALFVNIKVDREERPDLDSLYQTALALMGQQGGWPLTMFLTPEGAPFWGGTYFPPQPRFGRPGFNQVLEQIAKIYHTDPKAIADNREKLAQALERVYAAQSAGEDISADSLATAAGQCLRLVDWSAGGIGGAPKFPQAPVLTFLWRMFKQAGNERAGDAVLLTLRRMSEGGIYDHLGGGFARYAVDDRWLVPHFEKMLYDNAQILALLLEAWRETGDPLFRDRIFETVGWLLDHMRDAGGAFVSSFDADSEGEEGRYYVWQAADVHRLLGDDAALFKEIYDITPSGNWEGKSILNRLSLDRNLSEAEERRIERGRRLLLAERSKRVPPGRDDKVLADWNGLTIAALADAAMAFGEDAWLDAAKGAFAFVVERMGHETHGHKRLHHSYCAGKVLMSDVVDDYADMAAAALALFAATQDTDYLTAAEDWAGTARAIFEDTENGGFFLNPCDSGDLIVRVRTAADHAVPNANGILVQVFMSLYHLTYREDYRATAERTLRAFADILAQQPLSAPGLLSGFSDILNAPQIVVLGRQEDFGPWRRALFNLSIPGRSIRMVTTASDLPTEHPAHHQVSPLTQTMAFVCRGETCSLPITEPAALPAALLSVVE